MADTRLYDWLVTKVLDFQLSDGIANGFRPVAVASPFGDLRCTYDTDEDGRQYVVISFNMPNDVYAEIEDGTYGSLQGWRIYLEKG